MIVKRQRVEQGWLSLTIASHEKKVKEEGDSYFHKKSRNRRLEMEMKVGAFYIPKDNDPARPQGEDSYFVCKQKSTIGVADGVGGWARHGIDAGEYARELMTNSIIALDDEKKGSVNPRKVLEKAYLKTQVRGSSTACIITLNADNCLHYVNLGDSGFMLFRNKKYIYKSPIQQNGFNCPYQLGAGSTDLPSSAHEDKILVESGDIIVLGTDGLLDNMYPYEITEVFDEQTEDGIVLLSDEALEALAWTIAELALFNALDDEYLSPFAREAKAAKANKRWHIGGKYDDITVIVAQVK